MLVNILLKRKGFIEEALENEKKFQGIYGCSRPFSKDKHANSDSLYIQNNILWSFTKVLCQEAQVGPIYIGQFHTKMLRISNARANCKILEDILDIISVNYQHTGKNKGIQ